MISLEKKKSHVNSKWANFISLWKVFGLMIEYQLPVLTHFLTISNFVLYLFWMLALLKYWDIFCLGTGELNSFQE